MISFQVRFLLFQRKMGREGLIDGIPLLTSQSSVCPEMGWKEEGGDGEGIYQSGGNISMTYKSTFKLGKGRLEHVCKYLAFTSKL